MASDCYLRQGKTCGSKSDVDIRVSDKNCSDCEVGKIFRKTGCPKAIPVFDKLVDVTTLDSRKPEFIPGLANHPPYPGGIICQESGRRVTLANCTACQKT